MAFNKHIYKIILKKETIGNKKRFPRITSIRLIPTKPGDPKTSSGQVFTATKKLLLLK
jgi:hypothetical protein